MRRATAVRRGGALWTTSGVIGVGISSAIVLAASPRLLGHDGFSGLALVWTVSTVFGFGIAAPTEQLLTRRLNLDPDHGLRGPMIMLSGTATLTAIVSWIVGSHTAAEAHFEPLVPGIAIALGGWVALVAVRGRLAGSGDLRAYGSLLLLESATRCLFVAGAALDRRHAEILCALAVGAPLIIAAGAGLLVRVPRARSNSWSAGASEQVAFVLASVGYQVCLNSPPLLLEWHTGSTRPAAVGAFVAASSYFRVPTVLMGGIATHALTAMSHAWGRQDRLEFRASAAQAVRRTVLLATAAIGALALAAPLLLKAYYGGDLHLPVHLLASLAVSSWIAVLAAIVGVSLLAAGLAWQTAGSWLAGSVFTVVPLAVSSGTDAWASIGLVAGPVVALVATVVFARRPVRREPPRSRRRSGLGRR
jgi:O-antigen/teichoic acid export membrane protein